MEREPAERLRVLKEDIDRRVRLTTAAHPNWPCRKGCDTCCRRLAEQPRLTAPEWDRMRAAFLALPAPVQADISARVEALAGAVRPIICPFLDENEGSCLIYGQRPIACRTYGFYVERDGGLFCSIVESEAPAGVVWGNHAAVEAKLQAVGPQSDLVTWFGGLKNAAESPTP